jgi:hypothetical protein
MSAINMGTFVPDELCRIPLGAVVVEMKYCEFCGRPFARRFSPTMPAPVTELAHVPVAGTSSARGHTVWEFVKVAHDLRRDRGQRLCWECARKPSPELRAEELLSEQELYKMQLPDLDSIHASVHPIRYDRSIMGRETSAHRVQKKTPAKHANPRYAGNTFERRARAKTTRLTIVSAFKERGRLNTEELQALIPECYALSYVHIRLINIQLRPRLVGYVKKPGIRGTGMGVYVLDGVSPETLT